MCSAISNITLAAISRRACSGIFNIRTLYTVNKYRALTFFSRSNAFPICGCTTAFSSGGTKGLSPASSTSKFNRRVSPVLPAARIFELARASLKTKNNFPLSVKKQHFASMGDADLDYTIAFPEPSIPGKFWDENGEPVVILLGWAGSKDRHLAKYSAFYQNQGCIVIRYTAPWKAVFISESFGKKDLLPVAQKLLNLLFDYEIQKNPVMFHIFSNGGSMVYRYITELHQSHSQFSSLNIIGTVFDSGPGGKNVVGAAKALNVVLKSTSNVVVRYITLSFYVFLIVILRVFLYPLTKLIHEDHYSVMSNDQSRSPQLYLYSRGDKVINYLHVENLVKKRQQMGVPVQSIDFVTSEHVNHYREFPDDYSSVCILFLKDCLTRMAKPSRKDLSSKRAFPAAAAASLK